MSFNIAHRLQQLQEERRKWANAIDKNGATPEVTIAPPPTASPARCPTTLPTVSMPESPTAPETRRLRMIGYNNPRSFDELRVASIMDEFTSRCYAPECRLISFRPDNGREVLTETRPHFLFVESAWNGNGGSWQYRIANYNRKSDDLAQLLDWCREQGLPTVFWNKEDPFHFDRFIDNARRFDYIFTTDANMVPRYREAAGHDRVFVLPFSAQPAFHNPVRLVEDRRNKLCFAGSYYGDRHDTRRVAMETLLDAAIPFGLDIYDRNAGKNMPIFEFPDRFKPFILGSLAYDEIERAYKGYRCLLNVNTIQDSPTMFSRRVFEILASGTPVVSNPAQGLIEIFGPDLVQIADTAEGYAERIERLMSDDETFRRLQIEGIRVVMKAHTYRHRLLSMLQAIGIPLDAPPPEVVVMAFPRHAGETDALTKSFEQQSYEHKRLALIGKPDVRGSGSPVPVDPDALAGHHRLHDVLTLAASVSSPQAGTAGATASSPKLIACFAPGNYYAPNYLGDLVDAMTYSRTDIVGKGCCFEVGPEGVLVRDDALEFAYVESVRADAALFRIEAFTGQSAGKTIDFLMQAGDTRMLSRSGRRVFSSDRMNFLRNAVSLGERLEQQKSHVEC